MGNVIKWSLPDLTQVTYTKTYIYKSATKDGIYTALANQDITDNSYFDIDGSTNNWYKVAFRVGTTGTFSEQSDGIQGGKFNGYCSVDDVRNFASTLTLAKISDSHLFEFIKMANAQINQDIANEYRDEFVTYISIDKKNLVNGINKTYYTRNRYLWDYNNDGIIDSNDIYFYTVGYSGVRKYYTVDTIDNIRFGMFTLTEAPIPGERPFMTYRSAWALIDPLDLNVRKAAINYVAAMSYSMLDPQQAKSWRVNKVSVTGTMTPYNRYMTEYNNLISKIVATPVKELTQGSNLNIDMVLR